MVWLQATYNPVLDRAGRVRKIVKVATDVTAQTNAAANNAAFMAALSRVQAVIEFDPDGQVIDANANFLQAMGYRIDEIKGRHHRMFVDPEQAASAEYRKFWDKLRAGEAVSAEFQRVAKNGAPVWLSASYNPIYDTDGKLTKVIKFATVITERVQICADMGSALNHLAAGDLTFRIAPSEDQTFATLRTDFNKAAGTLHDMVLRIEANSSIITSTSREVAEASDQLAKRTEVQAANLEQTTAALADISGTIHATADNAGNTQEAVSTTKSEAEASGGVVEEAVGAMAQIEKSSSQVSQIIGVIDEIAFQTNLLALNAGVEAARAGEAGRGFAVVASEVRALAQRSASAAREIKDLIETSAREVSDGVALVRQTGASLSRISSQISDINGYVASITASSKEQSTGISEISTATRQLEHITRENAAMVEETTTSCHRLKEQAEELDRLVSNFKVQRRRHDGADLRAHAASEQVRRRA
jgi:methyl-accepting chemotaxis protein